MLYSTILILASFILRACKTKEANRVHIDIYDE